MVTETTEDGTTNSVAVITGASSGIGRAAALEFARQGYHVVLTARRQKELQLVAEECRRLADIRAVPVAADTTDQAALERVAERAIGDFGHIDVWVNDAAVSAYGKFLDLPLKDIRRILDTNVMGYVHGARLALQQFRLQGYGVLINITSVNAVAPVPYSSAYVASKFAVRGLSEALRMELEAEDLADTIHVCNVMPASVDTNLFQNAANYMNREVQAIEPVYDPTYVARAVVRLAANPKREITVGPAAKALELQHAHMHDFYDKMIGSFTTNNNFSRKPSDASEGNLYRPVEANAGMRGGWRERRISADKLNIVLGGAAAGILGLLGAGYVMTRRHR